MSIYEKLIANIILSGKVGRLFVPLIRNKAKVSTLATLLHIEDLSKLSRQGKKIKHVTIRKK